MKSPWWGHAVWFLPAELVAAYQCDWEGSPLPFPERSRSVLLLLLLLRTTINYYVHWAKTVFLLTLKPPTCDNAFSVCTFFSFILPVRVYHIVSSVNWLTPDFESGLWRKMCSWRKQVGVSSGGHADPGDLEEDTHAEVAGHSGGDAGQHWLIRFTEALSWTAQSPSKISRVLTRTHLPTDLSWLCAELGKKNHIRPRCSWDVYNLTSE